MLIPHDGSGPAFSVRVPYFALYFLTGLLIFSVCLVGSSFVYSSILSRRLAHYYQAIAKNREQQAIINSFSLETNRVQTALVELQQQDNQLRQLLGLKSWQSKVKLTRNFQKSQLADEPQAMIEPVVQKMQTAHQKLGEQRESLADLKKWVNQARERFANTPSCWPLYGRIVSSFGYRVYPWRGFHTGVDISASYGSAIHCTADGLVSFVGWQQGYGKTVIVDHGYGKSTLYAHCSRFTVSRGTKVKKGNLVAYVGVTGNSTGPHLHYEVREGGQPINPVAYLNLNVLTASRTWKGN